MRSMSSKRVLQVSRRELGWLFPRISLLVVGTLILFLLFRLGYLSSELYSLSLRIWLVGYIVFGAAIFRRYLIGSIGELLLKLGAHYVQAPKDRAGLRRSTEFYSRMLGYAIYILAILVSINLFFNLAIVWAAVGTTFTLIITFFIGLMTSSVLGNLIAYEAIRQTNVVSLDDVIETKDNVYGNVTSVGAFFASVKTPKNEIVSVPNLDIVNNVVKNYSKENPVIIHVPLGLGYDIRKDTAKNLLLEAAKNTEGVLMNPPPFVLFLELGNYSVTYEINAYTDRPTEIISIKSHLIENILDTFEKNKVEILSPQHAVLKILETKHTESQRTHK
jgi:small-conductance mechanosensitive channel